MSQFYLVTLWSYNQLFRTFLSSIMSSLLLRKASMQNTPCDVRPQPQTLREPPEQRRASCPQRSQLWGPGLWSFCPSPHGWLGLRRGDARHPTPVQLLGGMATPWGPELASSQVTPNPELHTEPPQKSYHLAPQLLSPAAWAREATWKQVGEAPPPS